MSQETEKQRVQATRNVRENTLLVSYIFNNLVRRVLSLEGDVRLQVESVKDDIHPKIAEKLSNESDYLVAEVEALGANFYQDLKEKIKEAISNQKDRIEKIKEEA